MAFTQNLHQESSQLTGGTYSNTVKAGLHDPCDLRCSIDHQKPVEVSVTTTVAMM